MDWKRGEIWDDGSHLLTLGSPPPAATWGCRPGAEGHGTTTQPNSGPQPSSENVRKASDLLIATLIFKPEELEYQFCCELNWPRGAEAYGQQVPERASHVHCFPSCMVTYSLR